MKKTKKTYTYKITIEGLTLQDIIEILAMKEKTESVERELPAFNDQLLLLLGSGLIFRDAFQRIADGYRSIDLMPRGGEGSGLISQKCDELGDRICERIN
jgi:hypothetical protein